MITEKKYIYKGDKLTADENKKIIVRAVKNKDKCIRGKNGNMLVINCEGKKIVVQAKRLITMFK